MRQAALASLALLCPGLAAADEARTAALQEIVISGRRPAAIERVAIVCEVSVVDIDARGARTLDEALELLPGVKVRTGGNGSPRIDVRGFRTHQARC